MIPLLIGLEQAQVPCDQSSDAAVPGPEDGPWRIEAWTPTWNEWRSVGRVLTTTISDSQPPTYTEVYERRSGFRFLGNGTKWRVTVDSDRGNTAASCLLFMPCWTAVVTSSVLPLIETDRDTVDIWRGATDKYHAEGCYRITAKTTTSAGDQFADAIYMVDKDTNVLRWSESVTANTTKFPWPVRRADKVVEWEIAECETNTQPMPNVVGWALIVPGMLEEP